MQTAARGSHQSSVLTLTDEGLSTPELCVKCFFIKKMNIIHTKHLAHKEVRRDHSRNYNCWHFLLDIADELTPKLLPILGCVLGAVYLSYIL